MPTLSDQISVLRKRGVTPAGIRQAMTDAYGVKPSVLVKFLGNDVRDIPGILKGIKADPAAARRNLPSPDTKPPEETTSVSLPSEVNITTDAEPPKFNPRLRHGPLANTARALGAVGAVGQDIITEIAGKHSGKSEVSDRITAARERIASDRRERLKGSVGQIVENDLANLFLAIPRVLAGTVGSFETRPGESSIEAGIRAGREILPGILAGIEEAAAHPWDTARAGPVTTLLTLLPAISAAGRLAKAATATRGAAEAAEISGATRSAVGKLLERHAPRLRQQWLDLYDAGDPASSQLLEDVLQTIPERYGAARRAIPELVEDAKAARRQIDTEAVARTGQVAPETAIEAAINGEPYPTPPASAAAAEIKAKGPANLELGDIGTLRAGGDRSPLPEAPIIEPGMTPAQRADVLDRRAELAGESAAKTVEGVIQEKTRFQQHRLAAGFAAKELEGFEPWLAGKAPLPEGRITPRLLPDDLKVDVPPALAAKDVLNLPSKPPVPPVMNLDLGDLDFRDFGPPRLKEVVDALHSLRRQNPAKFQELPPQWQDLARMEPTTIAGARYLASPQIAYALGVAEGGRTGRKFFNSFTRGVAEGLTRTAKEVALPLNLKAMVSNLLGNDFMTALWAGRLPLQSGGHGISLARKYVKFQELPAATRAAAIEQGGLPRFFSAVAKTGLTNSNVIAQDIGRMEQISGGVTRLGRAIAAPQRAVSKVAGKTGKLLEVGDTVYKLDVAKTGYGLVHGLLERMRPGDVSRISLTPRTRAVVTRLEDGNFRIRTPLKTFEAPAGSPLLDDLAAKFGAYKAKQLYFDYGGDLAGWPRWLRRAPVVGAPSPFWTWSYRALDVPGFKPGLGQAVVSGPTGGLSTSSRAGNLFLARAEAKRAIGLAALQAILPRPSPSEDYLRTAGGYRPSDRWMRVVRGATDPGALATARFSSASWLEPTLLFFEAARGGVEKLLGHLGATDDVGEMLARATREGRLGDPKTLRKLVRAAQGTDPVAAALGVAGLGGTIIFDTYADALDAERMGKSFDWGRAAQSVFVPRNITALVQGIGNTEGGRARRLSMAPEDPASRSDRLEWLMSQVVGLGYQRVNSDREMERFLRGVRQELEARAELWKKRRLARVVEMEGSGFTDIRKKQITEEADQIKQAITAAVDLARDDYERALATVARAARGEKKRK